jgi:hypothetical protein
MHRSKNLRLAILNSPSKTSKHPLRMDLPAYCKTSLL